MLPVSVYLDSSDFSRLADIGYRSDIDHLGPLFDKLREYREKGIAEYRYSVVHVTENLRYSEGAKSIAVRKFEVMEQLCGAKCCRHFTKLIRSEIELAFDENPASDQSRDYVFSNDDDWFPDLRGLQSVVRKNLIDGLKAMLRENTQLNRSQRRATEKKFSNTDSFEKLIRDYWGDNLSATIDAIRKEFPVSDDFYEGDRVIDFVLGRMTTSEINKEMLKPAFQPTKFLNWYYEKYDQEKKIPAWLIDLGDKIQNTIWRFQNEVGDADVKANDIKIEMKKRRGRFRLDIAEMVLRDRDQQYRLSGGVKSRLQKSQYGEFPSIDILHCLIFEYLKRHLPRGRQADRVLVSDAGDFMHAIYLPYFDLFRADKFFSQVAAPCATRFETKVVSRLEDLPREIDELVRIREGR